MASEPLQTFLSRLPSAKHVGGQWLAQCPAHDDRHASLAVREGDDGRVLVHCHAGCTTAAVLGALGLDETALFAETLLPPPKTASAILETYPYQDETGGLLYETVRLQPKDFRQRRPDGAGGWIWNLTGVRRVLFRLPDLQDKPAILICEGEKDSKAAWALEVPATTNVGGAGKWLPDYTGQLTEAHVRRVAILPDNDVPGRTHATQVAQSVFGAGLEVRVVILPDVPPKGDLSDYLATHGKADLLTLIRQTPRWTPEQSLTLAKPPPVQDFRRTAEGKYVWAMIPPGIMFELDRIRRDHEDLLGELTVKCDFTGVSRTQGGAILTAGFNLSSARARQERAKLLAQRAKTDEIDWMAALEEFCERVLEAERKGTPAIRLDESASVKGNDTAVRVEGLSLLTHHPVILFGDGGTAKSYLALYVAGRLAQRGVRVLYADWELLSDEHRDRLERLFGASSMPALWYASCDRPLVAEQERLLKIIRQDRIDYLIVDSVAVACDGPPEAAEVTTSYFRAIRSLGVGSLHLAHTNRSDQSDKKPFGSSFWHNLARGTWFCQRVDEAQADRVTVGLFNRKANLGPLLSPTGFTFQFQAHTTDVLPHGIEDIPELAAQLPLWQRMKTLLVNGPMTLISLAQELGAKENTITQTVKRRRRLFDRTLGADGIQRIRLVK